MQLDEFGTWCWVAEVADVVDNVDVDPVQRANSILLKEMKMANDSAFLKIRAHHVQSVVAAPAAAVDAGAFSCWQTEAGGSPQQTRR